MYVCIYKINVLKMREQMRGRLSLVSEYNMRQNISF